MTPLTMTKKQLIKLTLTVLTAFACFSSQATIVQFETNLGNFEVNLYDQDTPETVANFLRYVEDGDYSDSIIHRTVTGFIVQGGGFTYNGGEPLNGNGLPLNNVPADPAVVNEPVFSNIRGTIAMAKLGNNVNSATSQWFFNLTDNSGNLDLTNGGFTVFGEVTGDGMAFVDQIAGVSLSNFGDPFAELPLQNYDGTSVPDNTNFLIISSITITDPAVDTAAGLNPPLSIAPPPASTSRTRTGSMGGLMLILLLIGLRRVRK